jgi:hypothetical protein
MIHHQRCCAAVGGATMPFLPGHRRGEAFSGFEATRGFGGKNVAAFSGHTRVLAVLAKAACVHGVLSGFRARWQPDNRLRMLDGEGPAIAGGTFQ